MRSRTSLSLLVVLALALSGMGIVYSHWTDTLVVDGIADTGEVAAGWVGLSCKDGDTPGFQLLPTPTGDFTVRPPGSYGDPAWAQETFGGESNQGTLYDIWRTNKNVAHLTVAPVQIGDPSITLEWFETYPSYYDDCQLEFRNTGSVPIAVPYLVIEPLDGTTLASDVFANDGDIWVEWGGQPTVDQLDPFTPNDRATTSLKMHVEQLADPESSYGFTVTVCAHNWNEPSTVEDDVCDLYEPDDGKIVLPDPF